MDLSTLTAQLFLATVRIEASGRDGSSWTGTGFFYSMPFQDTVALTIVSNKHVLADARHLTIHLMRRLDNGAPDFGNLEPMVLTEAEAGIWAPHPRPAVDVGVLAIGTPLDRWTQQHGVPTFRTVGQDQFYDPSRDRVDAIEEVTFVGYPSGIFDSSAGTPIARRGVTATPPSLDYEDEPAFLIDAPVFGGSSGSPVFSIQGGMRPDVQGAITLGKPERAVLLGVLAAVHVRQVSGTVEALPASQIIGRFELDQELDLGIVYKASTIEECCEILRRSVKQA